VSRRRVASPALFAVVLAVAGVVGVTAAGQAPARTALAITGSEGVVVDYRGGLHPVSYGVSATITRFDGAPYWGWNIARGVALRSGDAVNCGSFGGYTVDGYGVLHPFGINGRGVPPAPSGGPYWPRWDIARGVALVPSDPRNTASQPAGGFVLDGFGGLQYFTLQAGVPPPLISGAPYWDHWDIARGVVILTDSLGWAGGYTLDGWGGLHPFAMGSSPATLRSPPAVNPATVAYWKGNDIARGVTLLPGSNLSGGFVVDGWGGQHPFAFGSGPAPDISQLRGAPWWQGQDVARGMAMTSGAPAGCAAPTDWTSRLFDPGHGSRAPNVGLTAANVAGLTQKWRKQAPGCPGAGSGGGWLATPVVFRGVIYEGSNFGCLYAINEADGTVIWSKFTAYQPKQTCVQQLGIVSTVNVQDDGAGNPVLYFHSPDGYLYKMNGSDGSMIWRTVVQIPSSTQNDVYAWSTPTVANGKVIVGVSSNCDTPFVQGQVRAYDAATGNLLWVHKMVPDGFLGAGDWYDAAVDGAGNVYVSTGSVTDAQANAQYSILKLDGRDGTLGWKAPAPKITGDPDYASSPVLFRGGGVDLVGATNKDGIFRVYRQVDGAPMWQAQIGTFDPNGFSSALAGGVWDGSRLFLARNVTTTGTWTQLSPGAWGPGPNGTSAAGSVRELDPATGNLKTVGGQPFELALPSNVLGPCSINANQLLICAGGHLAGTTLTAHDNGLYVIDTTQPPGVLRHIEDVQNYGEFAQPVQESGAVLAANTDALSKWG
jgi:outer membrane protein assembly factor BamB